MDRTKRFLSQCLSTGTFPSGCKLGRMHAILKSRNSDDTDSTSYRPICQLPVLGKIVEKILLGRLLSHTTQLFTRQYGFQKGKSTTDAIVKLKSMATEKYSLGIFADIKEAFDRV